MKRAAKWIGGIVGGFVVLIVIIIIIAVAVGGGNDEVAPATQPPPAQPAPASVSSPARQAVTQEVEYIEISAYQLYSEYENNEIAADQKYKGKNLKVLGIVDSIGTDILGSPYVLLTDGGEYEVWGVQCIFPNTQVALNKLATLDKGDSVWIKGKCKGFFINVLIDVG